MLKGEKLSKSYGTRKIINNVDIEFAPGEISVIIGPSGSGKTTLLKLIALLEFSDSGTLTVDEMQYRFPLNDKKILKPYPKLTVVFQQLFLWPHLTLLENITLPLKARKMEPNKEKMEELISLFQMGEFINRFPNEASMGQRQRVALARALMLDPKYILLDEVTSSLDIEQVAVILTHLKELAKRGIGILLITHLLNFAQEAADRVIFLEDGEVIESGGKDVLTTPKSERVRSFLSLIESAS
ncbi:MAG: ATP-binding cassette domain-containing protein [Candidatus Obscuribacter sp.]|nr:ATP-binding cassette domain-containing protein [Candidatus Obscuribacter sp.]